MARPTLWTSIADTLRAEIGASRYAPGERLPTEAQLSDRFSVNRHTVRRALAALTSEGLITTRRGAGAFVANRPTEYPIGRRVRFDQNILAAGRTPTRELLDLTTRPAEPGEAEALGITEGDPIHIYEGVNFVDGLPSGLFCSAFPAARFPGLLEHLQSERSVTRALRAEGVADYTRVSTRITAVASTATQAKILRLSPGAPLISSTSINADSRGVPVEFGRTFFVGDRVSLSLVPD